MAWGIEVRQYSLRGPLCAGEAFFVTLFGVLLGSTGAAPPQLSCWPTAKRGAYRGRETRCGSSTKLKVTNLRRQAAHAPAAPRWRQKALPAVSLQLDGLCRRWRLMRVKGGRAARVFMLRAAFSAAGLVGSAKSGPRVRRPGMVVLGIESRKQAVAHHASPHAEWKIELRGSEKKNWDLERRRIDVILRRPPQGLSPLVRQQCTSAC